MKNFTSFKAWLMLLIVGLMFYAPISQAQEREITGNVVCNDAYIPGAAAQTFNFTATWSSPDFEWFWDLDMTIPAGFTVISAGSINGAAAQISGNDIHWDCNYASSSGATSFTINMDVDPGNTGDFMFDWHIWGDVYGAPPHDVAGQSAIAQGIPSIDGYVLNGGGQTIAGVTVDIVELAKSATTDPTGYFLFYTIPDGTYTLIASKTGYNTSDPATVTITGGALVSQNFTLAAPNITVSPLIFDETLHPNEYMTTYLSLLNTGDGVLNWAAGIVYPMTLAGPTGSVSIPSAGVVKGSKQANSSTALAPASGTQGTQNPSEGGLRGAIAFGYEAIGGAVIEFDVDNVAGNTSVGSATPPDFVSGMAFPRNEPTFAYATVYGYSNLYMVDRATGGISDLGALSGSTPSSFNDITVDPTSGIFYGTGDDGLYAIDPNGMTSTFLGSHVNSDIMIGIACDAAGNMYGYDIGFDWFYSIDKFTGLATDVGYIGFNASYAQCMFYDQSTDNIVLGAFNAGNFYAEIRVADRSTGATSILSSVYYEEVTGAALPVTSGGGVEGWLTLSDYSGVVAPGGGTQNIGVNFDAAGTVAGEVYTADIVVSTNPFVGEITVPVTMTIAGDPLPEVTGFTATLTDDVTGEVTLMWNQFRDVTFEYFLIKRDGAPLTTTNDASYVDMLPAFGTYEYTVQPIYLEGDGPTAGPETVYWYEPELCYDNYAENTQWPDQEQTVTIELENCAPDGVLWFEFPEFVDANRDLTCDYTFEMFDSWGDGWNGNAMNLFVDGVSAGTATITSGSYGTFPFEVSNGADITGTWTYGSYSYECSYNILDCDGAVVYSGVAGDISSGSLYAVVPALFIVDVEPATGTIMAGEAIDVTLTYSSAGYPEGDYLQYIEIVTNEPDAPPAREQSHTVENWMYVVEPEMISGTVTDCNTGEPLENVMVTAYVDNKDLDNMFSTSTAEDGTYMLYVNPDDDYYMEAMRLGYQTASAYVDDNDLPAVVDFELCEEPYAVDWVEADPNEADTECMVTWSLPMGPYMIEYDDGTAEDYFSWVGAGGMSAVKFTPAGYPATVEAATMYVMGSGSVEFVLLDDDGPGGMPGTILDSLTTNADMGWVHASGWDVTFEEGDFYIAYRQLSNAPAAPQLGVDLDVPTVYRSYVKDAGGDWMVSAYNDFMIRAIVSGPGDNVMAASADQMIMPGKLSPELYIASTRPNGKPGLQGVANYSPVVVENPERDLATYQLYRVSDIDPDNGFFQEDGTHSLIEPALTSQMYNDTDWEDLDPGFYAYGVTATYDNDDVSDITYSEIVAHLLDNTVTLNISQCDDLSPEGAEVMLTGQNYPFQELTATTDATGIIVFDSVIDGTYDLVVEKEGYMVYEHNNIWIYDDYEETIVLQENAYPAKNMMVDHLTSVATWEAPASVQLPEEGFEDATFVPAGWTEETNSAVGWFRTADGTSGFVTIPAGDGFYACSNDDLNNDDGSMDYLIIPPVDLRGTGDYMLYFSAWYDGGWGQLFDVEISIDGGTTWTLLLDVPASADWEDYEVSLADYAGYGGDTPVYIAFHSDDNGGWSGAAAVDNVMVTDGHMNLPVIGYQLFLNGGYVASVDAETLEYQYQNLTFGETYEACVVAEYACGVSEPTCYTFTSTYLYPPRNLMDEYVYNTNEVPLFWNPPVTVEGPASSNNANVTGHGPVGAILNTPADPSTVFSGAPQEPSDRATFECAADAIFTNNNTPVDGDWSYGVSDASFPNTIFSSFSGLTESIGSVAFWGLQLQPGFIACNEDPRDFLIEFYEAGATPGALVASYTVSATLDPTGEQVAGFDVVQWNCEFASVNLAEGWMTIQSVTGDAAGCMFWWGNSVDGSGAGLSWNGSAYVAEDQRAFCLGAGTGGGGGVVPDGLISFNVYKRGSIIANVPYDGEGSEDWIMYVENNLLPGCYVYDVTAVYDLTDFGFPGEIGESAKEGPHEVCVVWGIDLPFCEDFTEGYDFNGWMSYDDNWAINSQVGNDAPSAQWNWDPDPGVDYESWLMSPPMNADMLTEGNIWLDFDLSLNNRNATGDEMMTVKVTNDGLVWMTVETYDNADGSFAFTNMHLDVTDYALDGVFQVAFVAEGVNSFDVIAWNVDNVCTYRTCDAPFDLTGEYAWNAADDFGAEICWEATPPTGGGGGTEELIYDNGVATGGYSYEGFVMATQMSPDGPCQVLELKYFISSGLAPFNAVVYDWAGTMPGTTELFNEGQMPTVEGDWMIVDIASDNLMVDGDFMVGFGSINGDAYMGYDTDLNNGRSWDYDNAGTWAAWSEAYLLRAVVQYPDGRVAEIGASISDGKVTIAPNFSVSEHAKDYSDVVTVDPVDSRSAERALTSFNVYRSMEGAEDYMMVGSVMAEEGVAEYCYFDQVEMGSYCYKVTAVYTSEEDECESDFALDVDEELDYVCVLITDVENPTELTTNLYPNPARDQVTITASAEMTRITVINYVGQLVLDTEMNQNRVVLNTSNFESGVYVVRIETESEVITKRFAVAR